MTHKEKTTSIAMGLDAIFSLEMEEEVSHDKKKIKNQQVLYVSVESIIPSRYQPRHVFEQNALVELANSISEHGILQPLIVRQFENEYELIAGERRWRAAKMASLTTVPVIVCDVDHQTTMAYGVIENIQRKNLSPLEEALSYERLLKEFSLTHEEIAKTVGKSRTAISNLLRLLALEEPVKSLLNNGKISMGHARALLSLESNKQVALAHRIVDGELSVRAVEALTSKSTKTRPLITVSGDEKRNIEHSEQKLSELLSRKVTLKLNKNGCGKLYMTIDSFSDLSELVEKLANQSA